ncbi:GGDEF domain-containing protein [Legionella parisiensis]|uniref:diguanylate cyclase n=1 Tax=Legionella parisiensis TaxID=45071 RepID=A0A1E5JRD3_9GAMM|nr:GGDEF domain-containing protein [Legionella parisiensis]KTD42726.1 two component response regulator with GGDEF domain protein [Legionella parisiensis]OEH47094.1 Phytochrome-like protein cph2 [Legionella parisiensis]STX71595.1 two component response regulator with GGDEF domain [Legionella parisiensis]
MTRKSIFQLQDECFLLLLESSLKAIPFNVLVSTVIAGYLLYRHASIMPVAAWYLGMIVLSFTRWINSKNSIASKDYIVKKENTKNHFLFFTFLTGALWGSCYILFYPHFSEMHQNVITLALGGMASGALASLSVYLPAYYCYLIPMFLPLIVYNFWLGGLDRIILAIMFILFVIMLIITAKFPSRLLQETLQLSKEKDDALQEVRRVSITDGLTGLYNRGYFDKRLDEEFKRAKRNNHPLNLVLIDVDDFKDINDNYGHPSGDLFLKQLAAAIKNSAKKANDSAFRIGGDEFAAILTNTSLDDAILLCNKLQNKFKKQREKGETTISIGIVSVSPFYVNDVDEVISAADKTLYEAKRAGKNQVRSQHIN